MKNIFIYSTVIFVSLLGMVRSKQYIVPSEKIQQTKQTLLFSTKSQQEYCKTNPDKSCIRLPHQQSQAARLWLQLVQTVWKDTNFFTAYYEQTIQKLFTLSPYRLQVHQEAIILWLHAYDMTQEGDVDFLYKQWQKIIPYVCDESRVQTIRELDEQNYIVLYNTRHQNGFEYVCEHYQIPALLGFIAYYYQQNISDAIQWYRIASMSPDALDAFVHMPALLTARYNERSTSIVLWYQRLLALYDSINTEQSSSQSKAILDQIEYITHKMIETTTLWVIKTTDDQYKCNNNTLCVQDNIEGIISKYNQRCQIVDNITDDAFCFLRSDSLIQQQIRSLDHPYGTGRSYMRRTDQEQWWVQFISPQ